MHVRIGRVRSRALADCIASRLRGAELRALFKRVRSSGRGRVVFLSGSEGSGRTWVLKRLEDAAFRPCQACRAGRLDGFRRVSALGPGSRQGPRRGADVRWKRPGADSAADWTDRPSRRPDRRSEPGGAGACEAISGRARRCRRDGRAPAKRREGAAGGMHRRRGRKEHGRLVARARRDLCRGGGPGPTAVSGPGPGRPSRARRARSRRGRCHRRRTDPQGAWIGRVASARAGGAGSVATALGPISSSVADELVALSGGQPEWIAELWQAWTDDGTLVQDGGGRWRFARSQAEGSGAARSFSHDRSGASSATIWNDSPSRGMCLPTARSKGVSSPADAVAAALEYDQDELIDFIDDVLVRDGSPLVQEAGFVEIAVPPLPQHSLCLYVFSSGAVWHLVRQLAPERERVLSGRMADALRALYVREGEAHGAHPRTLVRRRRRGELQPPAIAGSPPSGPRQTSSPGKQGGSGSRLTHFRHGSSAGVP